MEEKKKIQNWYRRITFFLVFVCLLDMGANAQNPKPFVVPELQEWNGGTGFFVPGEALKVVYDTPKLQEIANQFAEDYRLMFGIQPTVIEGKPQAGDFFLTTKKDKKLGREGYAVDIDKYVKISAPEPIGVYWATRTLLQMSEKNEGRKLPEGVIRDWPGYGTRGFLIDCGRKFIPMAYLQDLAKIMSYYKMNFLHIVLNNNGFPQYFNNDWNRTYAAFRLECDTYPGLTARDGYYTKDEFKDFQREAKSMVWTIWICQIRKSIRLLMRFLRNTLRVMTLCSWEKKCISEQTNTPIRRKR